MQSKTCLFSGGSKVHSPKLLGLHAAPTFYHPQSGFQTDLDVMLIPASSDPDGILKLRLSANWIACGICPRARGMPHRLFRWRGFVVSGGQCAVKSLCKKFLNLF